jgi:hypothetical protein
LQKHWVVYDSEQSFKLTEAVHGVLCGDDCRWVDNHLVHLLSPNIYRTPKEALEAFDYLATSGKYNGATAIFFIGKRLKKLHNITDERASLYEAAEEWIKALDNRTFMGKQFLQLQLNAIVHATPLIDIGFTLCE